MSHIATLDVQITNLDALQTAAAHCGLEFLEGQKTFRYYAHSQAPCDHALRVADNPQAYQMGLRQSPDLTHYVLVWDSYMGGYGLCDKVGRDAGLLLQAYGIEIALRDAEMQGLSVQKETDAEGNIYLVCTEV